MTGSLRNHWEYTPVERKKGAAGSNLQNSIKQKEMSSKKKFTLSG